MIIFTKLLIQIYHKILYQIISLIFISLLFLSCQGKLGSRVESENLTLYFDDNQDFETAKSLAIFWKENGLIGSRKQFIKLTKEKNIYFISLIANEPESIKTLDFNSRKQLLDLQIQIDSILPAETKSNIVICDKNFKPIYKIND
jgi:hypothetical protein